LSNNTEDNSKSETILNADVTRILMAEDQVNDAQLAEREIRKTLPFCVFLRVETRENYLRAIHEFQPDLIISDYHMPTFDGLSALKLALEYVPLTPVIIVTGAINEDTAVECMKAGASNYVIKEHLKRLGQAVVHALEEKKIHQERRRAEVALAESEERYRSLVQMLPDPILVTDRGANITFMSPSAHSFFGFSTESKVLGRNILEWIHPSCQSQALSMLQTVLAGGSVRGQELLLSKKDRSVFWGEVSFSCFQDAHAAPIGVITVVRDISERKQAEILLKESEERYRTLAEAANDAVYVLNRNGDYLYINSYGAVNLGKTPAEVIGKNLTDFFPPVAVDIQKNVLHKVFETGLPGDNESVFSIANRIAWLSTALVPLGKKDGRVETVMGISHDITELKLVEERLHRSNMQLSQAYDNTIVALSHALDLRDKETEGHTLRVIELTMRMAQKLGMKDEELVHVRRGAYMHDMGKIGIPDSILHKPSGLSADEWEVMRQHPKLAYEMLCSIEYLLPALDIPYCHHEKWDGTGYPQGLKGEEIPLAARLFAIVDVWDALTNERPYRDAWSREKTLDYIREQSGKHFDERIVKAFFEIITS
jgi:PAS domain S-box-containing protein